MRKFVKKIPILIVTMLIVMLSLVSVFSVSAITAEEIKNTYGIPDWLWNQVPQDYKERLEELLPEDFTLPGDIEIPELPEDFQLPEDFVFPELPENKEDFNVDDYIKNLADEVKEHFKTEYLADRQYYKIAYKANVLDLVVKDNFTRPESGFKSLLLDVYTDAVQALTAASVDNKFTLLAALQNGVDTAAVKEILNSIKSVSVDGLVIYDGSVRTDSIKALVKRLPLPSEIATYTDEQFRNLLSVDVKVVTESRGNLDITVNFGFEFANANNYARLRRIAQIVADNVSVSHKDGVYSVSVNVPQAFTRILNKAIATGKLSDSAKLKIFAALDKNVNEFAEFAKTITFEQVYNLLEKIDIVSCIDNTRLGKYFPDGITNERILNEFKKIEPYFEKIKTALIELVTFVPQRFQSKTMMDFYRGNGEFFVETWLYRIQSKGLAVTDYIKNTYTDSRILKWNSRLEKALNKLPMLSMFFNRESYMVSAEASVTLTDVYKVTYKDGENVIKCGLLPKDADLSFFAGITEISGSEILDWVDENGNSISKMPERDAEVYAVYDAGFKLEQSADIDTVYDGEAKQLKVNVVNLSSIEKTYDFGWYKIVGDSRVAIDGAYSDTLEVRNVLDSGKYICVVASGDTVKEAVFNVAIAKAKIDMTGVKWSYTAPFTYDGEIKTVSLNKEIEQLRFVGRLSARDVGTFNVSFELIDADNYELINLGDLSASLEWKIEKIKVDMTGVKWSYTAPFTYDGTTKTVSLVKAPSLVEVKGTLSATKAGTYTASFALKDTEHYELINLGDLATFLEWKIEKAKVDMTGVKWSYTAPFTYDGTTKTVSLVDAPSLVEVKGTLSAIKAGTYTASFALKDTENYEMVNAGALASSLEWKINKASVDLAGAAWDYTAPFTYDGTIKTVSLTMQFDKLKFSGNSATDAGTYTASFELKDAENYEIINKGSLSDSIEWKINKADIDMSAVARSFVDAEFVYDGKPHTLAVDSKLLPNGVKVKGYLGSAVTHVSESPKTITVQFELLAEKAVNYNVPADMSATVTVVAKEIGLKWENLKFTYDGSSHVPTATATGLVGNDTCKVTVYGAQTEVGVYTATAVSVDNADYKLPGSVTVSFEIEAASVIVPVTKIDPITGTTVTSTVLGNEMTMDVSDVTKDNKNIDVSKFAEKDKVAKILYVYEISFKIGNNVCKLENGNYEVSLVIPDGEAGKTYKVVVIDKNGNVTEINGTVSADGKSVKFNVTNLDGKFSLLEVEDKEVSELVEHAGVIVGVGSAVIVVFSAAALYFVVFRKKKRI